MRVWATLLFSKAALSFYHFFSTEPTGKYTVYLNDSAVAMMKGRDEIAKAFEEDGDYWGVSKALFSMGNAYGTDNDYVNGVVASY